MASPVYNEDHIVHLLSAPVNKDTTDVIQSGAVQTLCDLYDRKVTREEFITGAAQALQLYGQTAKLWMLHNIKGVYEHGNLDAGQFDRANEKMVESIQANAASMVDLVKRLQMCPFDEDKVH